jgi:hypothetical protein
MVSSENIRVGTSFLTVISREPYSIEDCSLEKKAPSKNTCNKIDSPRFPWKNVKNKVSSENILVGT